MSARPSLALVLLFMLSLFGMVALLVQRDVPSAATALVVAVISGCGAAWLYRGLR